MPIYEYRCPDCGHQFEALQKMSDGPLTECPACGQNQIKKLVSRTAFLLKGDGWYKDHYGLKSDTKATTTPSGDAKTAGSSSEPAKATPGDGAKTTTPPPASSSSSSSSAS